MNLQIIILASEQPTNSSDAGWIVSFSLILVFLIFVITVGFASWFYRGSSNSLIIGFLRLTNIIYSRTFHGIQPSVPDPFSAKGPFLLIANHRSSVDPCALSAYTRRDIRFLMAREYYEVPVARWLFKILGAIPVNRDGNDLAAAKTALKALKNGEIIGIFPEGRIQHESPDPPFRDMEDESIKHGAALLAIRSGAPVITAYIEGTPPNESTLGALVCFSRSRVSFGEPLHFKSMGGGKPSREDLEEATQTIIDSILSLKEQVTQKKEDPALAANNTRSEKSLK